MKKYESVFFISCPPVNFHINRGDFLLKIKGGREVHGPGPWTPVNVLYTSLVLPLPSPFATLSRLPVPSLPLILRTNDEKDVRNIATWHKKFTNTASPQKSWRNTDAAIISYFLARCWKPSLLQTPFVIIVQNYKNVLNCLLAACFFTFHKSTTVCRIIILIFWN